MNEYKITEMGKILSNIPISPRFGRLILEGRQKGVYLHAIIIAAVLGVDEFFKKQETQKLSQSESEHDSEEDDFQKVIRQKKAQKRQNEEQIQNRKSQIKNFMTSYKQHIGFSSDLFVKMSIVGKLLKTLRLPPSQSEITSLSFELQLLPSSVHAIVHSLLQIHQILSVLTQTPTLSSYQDPSRPEQEALSSILLNVFQNVTKIDNKQKVLPQESVIRKNKNETQYVVFTHVVERREKLVMINATEVSAEQIEALRRQQEPDLEPKLKKGSERWDALRDAVVGWQASVYKGTLLIEAWRLSSGGRFRTAWSSTTTSPGSS